MEEIKNILENGKQEIIDLKLKLKNLGNPKIENLKVVVKKEKKIIDNPRNRLEKNEITIQNDRNEIIIQKDDFQKLFRVGYCFTCHSVQGMSIDKPYTIHEWERMHKKLKYVALSRATKKENINIM